MSLRQASYLPITHRNMYAWAYFHRYPNLKRYRPSVGKVGIEPTCNHLPFLPLIRRRGYSPVCRASFIGPPNPAKVTFLNAQVAGIEPAGDVINSHAQLPTVALPECVRSYLICLTLLCTLPRHT